MEAKLIRPEYLYHLVLMRAVELFFSNTINEPVHEKTNNLGFRPGPTQTRLYSHRSRLEA